MLRGVDDPLNADRSKQNQTKQNKIKRNDPIDVKNKAHMQVVNEEEEDPYEGKMFNQDIADLKAFNARNKNPWKSEEVFDKMKQQYHDELDYKFITESNKSRKKPSWLDGIRGVGKVSPAEARLLLLNPVADDESRRRLENLVRKDDLRVLYDSMRVYIPQVLAGTDITKIVKENGERLTMAEGAILKRICPRNKTHSTGRNIKQFSGGRVVDTTYVCPYNLAGRVFFMTIDGYQFELPIKLSNQRCKHPFCASGHIRKGGESDLVFITVPYRHADLEHGVFVQGVADTIDTWNSLYHESVYACGIAKANITLAKFRALLGSNYIPQSQFAETIVFMTRVLGLNRVGFLAYDKHRDLLDGIYLGRPGSSDAFVELIEHDRTIMSNSFTNYAWGLHHLCQLRAMYPSAHIPFIGFLHNLDVLSRKSPLAIQRMVNLFETEKDRLDELRFRDAYDNKAEDRKQAVIAQTIRDKDLVEEALASSIPEVTDINMVHRLKLLNCIAAANEPTVVDLFGTVFQNQGFVPRLPYINYDKFDLEMRVRLKLEDYEPPDLIDNFEDMGGVYHAKLLRDMVLKMFGSDLNEVD